MLLCTTASEHVRRWNLLGHRFENNYLSLPVDSKCLTFVIPNDNTTEINCKNRIRFMGLY